jgi:tetratricopeptide (TPR) repeat protein
VNRIVRFGFHELYVRNGPYGFIVLMTRLTLIAFILLSLSSPGLAQSKPADKATLLKQYEENKSGTAEQQKIAYESAKDYLLKFGAEDNEQVRALRKYVAAYERLLQLDTLLKARDYPKIFELGKQILAGEPDNFFVITKMTEAGLSAAQSGNATLTTDTIAFSRKALQLIDSGKVKDPSPFANAVAARNYFNIALANLLLDSSPEESAELFLKLLHSDEYKTEPSIYYYFGRALLKGDYQKLVAEYKQKFEGKPAGPDQQEMLRRINVVVEKIVDTYARAVALSTKPEQQQTRKEVLGQLTQIYMALHNNSAEGLDELIATVLTKPMP